MSESLGYTPSIDPVCFNLDWRKHRSAFAARAVAIARASVGYPNQSFFTTGSQAAEAERVQAGQLKDLRRGIGVVALKLGGDPNAPADWLAYGYAYQKDTKVVIGSLQAMSEHGQVLPEVAYTLLGKYDSHKEVDDSLNALRILYEGDFTAPWQHARRGYESVTPPVESSRLSDDTTVAAYRQALLTDFLVSAPLQD